MHSEKDTIENCQIIGPESLFTCLLNQKKIRCSIGFQPQPMAHTSISAGFWPSLFVLASQVLATSLNAAAKFTETMSEPVHPFMILHIRMLITGTGCTLCLWRVHSPKLDIFLGGPEVRHLLLIRAFGGICGTTGFFCMFDSTPNDLCHFNFAHRRLKIVSIKYLNLSEATALNFISPLGSLILTRWLSFATVQWIDCFGAFGSLVGVALILVPHGMLSQPDDLSYPTQSFEGHLKGIGFSTLGVCGGVVSSYFLTTFSPVITNRNFPPLTPELPTDQFDLDPLD